MIPERIKEAIDRHAQEGCPCGDFVTAVLENNLMEAFSRADDENEIKMGEIIRYCYNEIPGNCWGNKERVRAWREQGLRSRAEKEKAGAE